MDYFDTIKAKARELAPGEFHKDYSELTELEQQCITYKAEAQFWQEKWFGFCIGSEKIEGKGVKK